MKKQPSSFQMNHFITRTSFATEHEPPPRHNSSLFDVDAVGDSSTIKANSTNQQEHSNKEREGSRLMIYCSLFMKKKKLSDEYREKHNKERGCNSLSSSTTSPQSESVPPELGKSSSKRRHLSMFRNLINCGATVNTNDAAFIRLNNRNSSKSTTYSCFEPPNRNSDELIIIRKETRNSTTACTVGSAGNFRTTPCMEERPQKPHNRTSTSTYTPSKSKSDDRNQKEAASANHRPMRGPHCSHCKKQFKPEKLHSHMKSCKGTKSLAKSAPARICGQELIIKMQ